MKAARFGLAALFSIVFFFGFTAFNSFAEPGNNACGKPTPWSDFNVFTLKVTSPDVAGYYSSWRGQFDKASNDMQIEGETSEGSATKTEKILVVGGRVLAMRGNLATPGYEIDALDGPVLQYQLLVRLLGAAVPDGAAGLKGVLTIDHSSEKTGIQYATPSAQGFIPPPWRAKGTVKVAAPDVIEYELALTAVVEGKRASEGGRKTINFSGRLWKLADARLDDSMALDGWTFFWIGPYTKKVHGGTIYDYGATPVPKVYKTVARIRADIRNKKEADNYPGYRDPSKDLTGFWKESCDETFGLQIVHYGLDGRYSIVFCGPGGCLDPSHARKTFITGDKEHFEVVSEDDLIRINRDGSKTAYHRCTKDPHPVLSTQK